MFAASRPLTVPTSAVPPSRVSCRRVRFRLLPSDDRFFDLFNAAATNVAACSRRLRELLEQPGPGGSATIDAVIACEQRGDELTRDILRRLNTSFVTPFDREDIHALAEELDDVVDDMLEVAYRLELARQGRGDHARAQAAGRACWCRWPTRSSR